MTAPTDAMVKKVRDLVALADDDLRVAQHTLSLTPECPYHLAAYHAQQSAEKHL